ncbi:MAG: hypothetical protein K9J72_02945 [Synechococcus sp. Tobar2m-G35]|jgi:hypothetical protein|nr:hypothetical protein [Synechococcus sp. Tobar2m-G35]
MTLITLNECAAETVRGGFFDLAAIRQVSRQNNAGANVAVGLVTPFQGIIQGNSAVQFGLASA